MVGGQRRWRKGAGRGRCGRGAIRAEPRRRGLDSAAAETVGGCRRCRRRVLLRPVESIASASAAFWTLMPRVRGDAPPSPSRPTRRHWLAAPVPGTPAGTRWSRPRLERRRPLPATPAGWTAAWPRDPQSRTGSGGLGSSRTSGSPRRLHRGRHDHGHRPDRGVGRGHGDVVDSHRVTARPRPAFLFPRPAFFFPGPAPGLASSSPETVASTPTQPGGSASPCASNRKRDGTDRRAPAVLRALEGPAQGQGGHRARDADVGEPPLLLDPALGRRARVRQQALLHARPGTRAGTRGPWPRAGSSG